MWGYVRPWLRVPALPIWQTAYFSLWVWVQSVCELWGGGKGRVKWTPTLVMTILLGQDQDRGRGWGARDEDSGLITQSFCGFLSQLWCARCCQCRYLRNIPLIQMFFQDRDIIQWSQWLKQVVFKWIPNLTNKLLQHCLCSWGLCDLWPSRRAAQLLVKSVPRLNTTELDRACFWYKVNHPIS